MEKKNLIFTLADIRTDAEIEDFVDELLDQLEVKDKGKDDETGKAKT